MESFSVNKFGLWLCVSSDKGGGDEGGGAS